MRPTLIAIAAAGVFVLGFPSWPSSSFAQTPGPAFAAVPMALPLGKVPVGTWSEYRLGPDAPDVMWMKLALVGRRGKAAQIETTLRGGVFNALGPVTLRSFVDIETGADLEPGRHALRVGANRPMLVPGDMGAAFAQTFRKPDPKDSVGLESVTVPAATFSDADHNQTRLAGGRVIDTWLKKDVAPFGLIKMIAGADMQGRPVTMELVARGRGAQPAIGATVLPFDRNELIKQLRPMVEAQIRR